MKTARHIAALLAALWALGAQALTVNVVPGGLREAVEKPGEVTELTVRGSVDMTDFEFITLRMENLRVLDLGGATVSAYRGVPTAFGRTSAAADELPEGALMVASLESVTLPAGLTAIGDGALGGTSVSSITLPATLRTIGRNAFAESKKLKFIALPASVTEIGAGAFAGCTSLERATVGGAVTALPPSAFQGCTVLTSVSLPAALESIGARAFAGCTALQTLSLPASLRKIESGAFFGSGLRTLDMSGCSALEEIGDWAFASVPSLEQTVFPPSVGCIGEGAFFNDINMPLEALPGGLTEISDYSLRGVNASAEIDIPDGVTAVGRHALAQWKGIQVLTLPSTLEEIGDGAMAGWSALRTIDAGKTNVVPRLGADVWAGIDRTAVTLTVSNDLKEAYEGAPQWQEFDIRAEQNAVELPSENPEGALTARFEGLTLHLEGPEAITSVALYDLAGRCCSMPVSGSGERRVSVDTSAWDTPVMIVRVTLADGSHSVMKLSR